MVRDGNSRQSRRASASFKSSSMARAQWDDFFACVLIMLGDGVQYTLFCMTCLCVCIDYYRLVQWWCFQKAHIHNLYMINEYNTCISGERSQRPKKHMHYHHCPKDISSWWWDEAEHSAAWNGSAGCGSFSRWKKVCWVLVYTVNVIWRQVAAVSVPSLAFWRSVQITEKKTTGERRHCKWCLKYKPDRLASHSIVVSSCIYYEHLLYVWTFATLADSSQSLPAQVSSLPCLQYMRAPNGSPLPVGVQLHWLSESQVLHSPADLFCDRPDLHCCHDVWVGLVVNTHWHALSST